MTEPFTPHSGQLEVINDKHRYRIVNCGRRWGKTTLAVNEMLAYAAFKPDSLVVYVAPTIAQARDIAWRMLKDTAQNYGAVSSTNETRLEIKINQSEVWLRGVENYESLRGLGIHFLVVDEMAMMRNWQAVWGEVLRATLADTRGQALFCSTPKGYNHWYEWWMLGQERNSDYMSWSFPSSTNPYMPPSEIEAARQELSEDAFEQEWEAKFRTTVGLVHPAFDRQFHLLDPFEIPKHWKAARGLDFGAAHPTASVRVRIDEDGNWFADHYYKQGGRSTEEHAAVIMAKDYELGFVPAWGDPTGKQWFLEFEKIGLNVMPAVKEKQTGARTWVEFCVEEVNRRLKKNPGRKISLPDGRKIDNAPELYFLKVPGWKEMAYELENLKWKATTEGGFVPTLDEKVDTRGHFDLLASLRYLAVSYRNSMNTTPTYQWEKSLWKIGKKIR